MWDKFREKNMRRGPLAWEPAVEGAERRLRKQPQKRAWNKGC